MVALFVVLAFLFFISLDLIVLKVQGKTHPAFEETIFIPGILNPNGDVIHIPQNIILAKGHTWLKKHSSGNFQIGIDDFVPKVFGKVSISKFAETGKSIKEGEVIFEGNVNNQKLKFRSPIEGTIKSINSANAGKNISNPYNDWQIIIKPTSSQIKRNGFFIGKDSLAWMEEEYKKLEKFINAQNFTPNLAGVTMYDGGKLLLNALPQLLEQRFEEFENEFLTIYREKR